MELFVTRPMKKIFITSILMLSWILGLAQNPIELDSVHQIDLKITKNVIKDIRLPIMKSIANSFNSELLHAIPKNYAYMTSIAVSFDLKGKIDSVYFPQVMSIELKNIIRPAIAAKEMKSNGIISSENKGEVILFPILIMRSTDTKIDYDSSFLGGFLNLWPTLSVKDQKKKLVILKPYLNHFLDAAH